MTSAVFSAASVSTPTRGAVITGRVLSGLGVAFLAFDTALKLLQLPAALEGSAQLGFDADAVFRFGVLELTLLVAYLLPRTAILGAVLWTGYLGGAMAIHVRLGNPLFSHVLFPIYVGLFLWGGLWLRDARLRTMIPFTRRG